MAMSAPGKPFPKATSYFLNVKYKVLSPSYLNENLSLSQQSHQVFVDHEKLGNWIRFISYI